jgi:hypothetical protein
MAQVVEKQAGKQRGGITGKGFVPGQSGNPKGRPKKGELELDRLNERYGSKLPNDRAWMPKPWQAALSVADKLWPGKQRTFQDLADAARLIRSLSDEATAKNLDERRFGKATQPITGKDGEPLQVQTVVQFVGCGVKAATD